MRNRKKIYFNGLYYFFGTIFAELCGIAVFILCIAVIILDRDYPQIIWVYIGIPVTLTITVSGIILFGTLFWQWVVIDEKAITSYCLFGKIRSMKWEDIKVVHKGFFNYATSRVIGNWLVFIERGDEDVPQTTGGMLKKGSKFLKKGITVNTNIVLKNSKKREKFIRSIHPEINIETPNAQK